MVGNTTDYNLYCCGIQCQMIMIVIGVTIQIIISGFHNRPHQRVYPASDVPVWTLSGWYSEGVCELHSHRYRKTSYPDWYSSAFPAFNTARWKPSVSGLPWPGPVHEDRAKYDNFTCFFKVLGLLELTDFSIVVQAFRESAPLDLSLSQYWGYPKDMEWMLIIAIKLAFIVVFEVFLLIILYITRTILFSTLCLLLWGSLLSASLIFLPVSSYRSVTYYLARLFTSIS